jgi:glycine cleavage system H protein
MKIKEFEFPDDLYYDLQHGWARVEGNVVTMGLTDFGQKIAKEIVFVEAPPVGRAIQQGQTFMSMESGKWVGRVPAVVTGKITEVNGELEWEPSTVNQSPFDAGWLAKIEMSDQAELSKLHRASSPEFKAFIEGEADKFKELL